MMVCPKDGMVLPAQGSAAESLLAFQLTAAGLPGFERQYRYVPGHKFTADFAYTKQRILIHVDGGVYSKRAHGSITGILADITRHNLATLAGWRSLRCTPDMVKSGEALRLVEQALRIEAGIP